MVNTVSPQATIEHCESVCVCWCERHAKGQGEETRHILLIRKVLFELTFETAH